MPATAHIVSIPSFDELVALAEQNPDALEQLRQEKCEEMIAHSSEVMRDRLRAQQTHIDRVITHCKNPNHVNVVLMQELTKQFSKFQDSLQVSPTANDKTNERQSAQVIPFNRRDFY